MKTTIYDITFNVPVVTFSSLSEYQRGALLREFVVFIENQAKYHKFLCGSTSITTEEREDTK